MEKFFWTDEEIAQLLGLTTETLRNKISAGHPLPPYRQLPYSNFRIWPKNEFEDYFRKLPAKGARQ